MVAPAFHLVWRFYGAAMCAETQRPGRGTPRPSRADGHGVPCPYGLFASRRLALGGGAGGEAAFFSGDGLGVDEPLAVAGASGLLLFRTS